MCTVVVYKAYPNVWLHSAIKLTNKLLQPVPIDGLSTCITLHKCSLFSSSCTVDNWFSMRWTRLNRTVQAASMAAPWDHENASILNPISHHHPVQRPRGSPPRHLPHHTQAMSNGIALEALSRYVNASARINYFANNAPPRWRPLCRLISKRTSAFALFCWITPTRSQPRRRGVPGEGGSGWLVNVGCM